MIGFSVLLPLFYPRDYFVVTRECLSSTTVSLYLVTLQHVTRLSSFMSIHQFPGLLYQLRRNNQPRPLSYMVTRLQQCIQRMSDILPWGIAMDSLQIALLLLKRRGLLLHSSSSLHNIYSNTLSIVPTSIFPHISRRFSLMFGMKLHLNMTPWNTQRFYLSWKFTLLVAILTMGPPLAHIIAFFRIWKVKRYSNISLSTKLDDLKYLIQNNTHRNLEENLGLRWRHRLEWREPKTLSQSIRSLWKSIISYKMVLFYKYISLSSIHGSCAHAYLIHIN